MLLERILIGRMVSTGSAVAAGVGGDVGLIVGEVVTSRIVLRELVDKFTATSSVGAAGWTGAAAV